MWLKGWVIVRDNSPKPFSSNHTDLANYFKFFCYCLILWYGNRAPSEAVIAAICHPADLRSVCQSKAIMTVHLWCMTLIRGQPGDRLLWLRRQMELCLWNNAFYQCEQRRRWDILCVYVAIWDGWVTISHEQCMNTKKFMICLVTEAVEYRRSAEANWPLWGTLSPSPSDRPAELEFPMAKEQQHMNNKNLETNIVKKMPCLVPDRFK